MIIQKGFADRPQQHSSGMPANHRGLCNLFCETNTPFVTLQKRTQLRAGERKENSRHQKMKILGYEH